MRYTYEALLTWNVEDGVMEVDFPDLPGICTYGRDFEEAVYMAADALELLIATTTMDGDALPRPTFGHSADDSSVIAISVNERPYADVIEFVSTAKAGRLLGITPGRVRQLIQTGHLKAKKDGRDHQVLLSSVEEYRKKPRKVGRPHAQRAVA